MLLSDGNSIVVLRALENAVPLIEYENLQPNWQLKTRNQMEITTEFHMRFKFVNEKQHKQTQNIFANGVQWFMDLKFGASNWNMLSSHA